MSLNYYVSNYIMNFNTMMSQWVAAEIKIKLRPPKFRLYLDQI